MLHLIRHASHLFRGQIKQSQAAIALILREPNEAQGQPQEKWSQIAEMRSAALPQPRRA
jgi:hypothetical protein